MSFGLFGAADKLLCHTDAAMSDGPLEEIPGLRHVFGGQSLVPASPALEIQVQRIGMQRASRPLCLSLDELCIQRVSEPRYDFVLHVEQVGDRLVEAFGPKVIAGFGINQLHVYPKPVAAALHRTVEYIANVQLAFDLPHVG